MQVCSGKEAGHEAAIHVMYGFYQRDEMEKI